MSFQGQWHIGAIWNFSGKYCHEIIFSRGGPRLVPAASALGEPYNQRPIPPHPFRSHSKWGELQEATGGGDGNGKKRSWTE